MKDKYLIGIDEAGRGPLAGPVSVGVVCVASDFNWDLLPGVNDSKKLSEKKREEIFTKALELKNEGKLHYCVVMVSALIIDKIGIVPAVSKAMHSALAQVVKESKAKPSDCIVKLDGSLSAPAEFEDQETIIGGDGKEKVIGLGSILAKVTRDRHMVALSKKKEFSGYLFQTHKGYGTLEHRRLIRKYGLSVVHRKSYCRKLI
jgi:ribonuclease HII